MLYRTCMINQGCGVIGKAKTEQRDPRHMIRTQHYRDHLVFVKPGDEIWGSGILGVSHIHQN